MPLTETAARCARGEMQRGSGRGVSVADAQAITDGQKATPLAGDQFQRVRPWLADDPESVQRG